MFSEGYKKTIVAGKGLKYQIFGTKTIRNKMLTIKCSMNETGRFYKTQD